MTEDEWLSNTDPTRMVKYLADRASKRKLRLFACACCWPLRSVFPTQAYHQLIEVAERFAEGNTTAGELDKQYRAVATHSNSMVAMAACGVADPSASWAASKTAQRVREVGNGLGLQGATRKLQASMLRDIYGNPFRPISLATDHRTPTVASLARAAYDERQLPSGELDPLRLAVLADALEEVGAPDEMVAHLRDPGPHGRGCWAVDLALGLN